MADLPATDEVSIEKRCEMIDKLQKLIDSRSPGRLAAAVRIESLREATGADYHALVRQYIENPI